MIVRHTLPRTGSAAPKRLLPAFAALMSALFVPVAAAQSLNGPSVETLATVFRDAHGVPHIVAEDEPTAWYALGYEQARDGLLWIQYACKAARGELVWAGGYSKANLRNDIVVQVFQANLAGKSVAQLRAMFAPTNPAITANFYDNCLAYAAGVNDYRLLVKSATATPVNPEYQLKSWLDTHSLPGVPSRMLSWVYDDTVSPYDILSQGRWTTATMSALSYGPAPVNSSGTSFGLTGGGGDSSATELVPDPMSPTAGAALFDGLRAELAAMPGAASAMCGSNSFCWTKMYCFDPANSTSYSGLVGDPHHGVPFFAPAFPALFAAIPNHMWYAHVQVQPVGASQPTYDVFGHMPHASAAFFSSHSRRLALGGTLGAPNHTDRFLLRLKENPSSGLPLSPPSYYSYYFDTNGNSGADPSDFRSITTKSVSIKRTDGTPTPIDYWRADSFGVVLPDLDEALARVQNPTTANMPSMQIVYGERVVPGSAPPAWRVTFQQPQMRYWASPQTVGGQLVTSPMVVTLRAPIDDAVSGEDMHSQLMRDFWEITHAQNAWEVLGRTNGAAYLANIDCVDRDGRTFSSQMTAIPRRGDDAALQAAGYHAFDKFTFYNGAAGPVPARHYSDRMFDWRFGTSGTQAKPAPLSYLQYPSTNPIVIGDSFKPMSMWDPTIPGAFPSASWTAAPAPFVVEGAGFAAVCNDTIWGFSRKWDTFGSGSSALFNDVVVTNNQLLQMTLDAGTIYQSAAMWAEGPVRNQIVVEQFTRQAERIVRGSPAGAPPLTPAQMRTFVVTPREFNEPRYTPPTGVAVVHADYPTPIRQLAEVVDNPGAATPLAKAQQELRFFRDFWAAIYGQLPGVQWQTHAVAGQSGLTVNLKDVWVTGNVSGHANQLFWYDDPQNTSTLRWIDMPSQFPLVDFLWSESEVGRGATTGAAPANVLSSSEQGAFAAAVSELITWEAGAPTAELYQNRPASRGACLLQMMRAGYDGVNNFGRHWVRLQRGQVVYSGSPVTLTTSGQLPSGTAGLEQQSRGWSSLSEIAFPQLNQRASLCGDQVPTPTPPYAALYLNGSVRTTLTPVETNALVRFFLELGGYYIDPAFNNGNPSRKLARLQLAGNDEQKFLARVPGSYPLTGGLAQLTAVRALLDADHFLRPGGGNLPPFSQYFRARAYDHNSQQIWPTTTLDADCVGGSLRAVNWFADLTAAGFAADRGYQPKFLGMGGSYATMLSMFPDNPQLGVESYFWCSPGVEAMTSNTARFNAGMNAFATNVLLPSHFWDFDTTYVATYDLYYEH